MYDSYIEATRDYLSAAADLNKYICDFFQKENIGVSVILNDSPKVEIRCKLQRHKEFEGQVAEFYKVCYLLCKELGLKMTYNESSRWDTHLDMPLFGEEIVYLVGDR